MRLLLYTLVLVAGVGSVSTAAEYTEDGTPNSNEELQRWYFNRARFNPEAEADRLGLVNPANRDYDVCEDQLGDQDFGTNEAAWAQWIVSQPPVAPHASLITAARNHCSDMAAVGYENGGFSHYSPTNTHYPTGTSPFTRMSTEGYNYLSASENAALGRISGVAAYGMAPAGAHNGLFRDTNVESRGHRKNILGADHREIGTGWVQNYRIGMTHDWYTQDVGSRRRPNSLWKKRNFFTGTIFHDANGNGAYEEGEGVGGIEVRLFDGAVEHESHDVSTASGSFAVPIHTISTGVTMTVTIVNDATPRTLTIPTSFSTSRALPLDAGEAYNYGTFALDVLDSNVGFRELTPSAMHTIVAFAGPHGAISPSGTVEVASGAGKAFGFTADPYYHVDDVVIDGGSVGSHGSHVFTNVMASHTISVHFAVNLVTNDTPEPWLASYGLTNFTVDALADVDGDGLPAWGEYWAGTDPTNARSVFAVLGLESQGDQMTLSWYGTTNSGVTNAFCIYGTTGLVAGVWETLASNVTRHASGINAWPMPAPSGDRVFYRVGVMR